MGLPAPREPAPQGGPRVDTFTAVRERSAAGAGYVTASEAALDSPWLQLPPSYRKALTGRLSPAVTEAETGSVFNSLTPDQRVALLHVMTFMGRDGIWKYVKQVTRIGSAGVIGFIPNITEDELRGRLTEKGFGDWWGADQERWGLRHHNGGPQLHIIGVVREGRNIVNAHIDLNNPGDPGGESRASGIEELPAAVVHLSQDHLCWPDPNGGTFMEGLKSFLCVQEPRTTGLLVRITRELGMRVPGTD